MNITTYDILQNKEQELEPLISSADYITLHIDYKLEMKNYQSKNINYIKLENGK